MCSLCAAIFARSMLAWQIEPRTSGRSLPRGRNKGMRAVNRKNVF
jgi:hypothetical protein